MTLTAIILTKNEERHIVRALASLAGVATRCVVVDSGSTDKTVALARAQGALVLENPWTTHAAQFNWALDQLPEETEWVLRLDADEVISAQLASEIKRFLATPSPEVEGVYLSRRIRFLGRDIQWGGVFPIRILRLFRYGCGCCENRWMDEHIVVSGKTADLRGEIVDDNLNSLGWWTQKHNDYAAREAVDVLNLEHGFLQNQTPTRSGSGEHTGVKRWVKQNIYLRLPGGVRALAYFTYRYFIRLGFLDGKQGTAFHVLQGFWYRYLVDMKLYEVRRYMHDHDVDVTAAIKDVLRIDIPVETKSRHDGIK